MYICNCTCVYLLLNRCIYSKRKLSTDEMTMVQQLKEDADYCCGVPFIPDDHQLNGVGELFETGVKVVFIIGYRFLYQRNYFTNYKV